MDALKFIEDDVHRGQATKLALCWLTGLMMITGTAGLGLWLRESTDGTLKARVLLPNAIAALLLAVIVGVSFKTTFSSGRLWRWACAALPVIIVLATERVFFPLGPRTEYFSSNIFWIEGIRCFSKGLVAAGVVSLVLLLGIFQFSSLPSRRWRPILAALVGCTSTVMLGFHCDSSSAEHVVLGHITSGFVMGLLTYAIGELLFRLLVQKRSGLILSRVRDVDQL